jgi:primosomal protein N'
VISTARRADPGILGTRELTRRRELRFPPFGGLAEVSGDADAVETVAAELRTRAGITVLGPSGTPLRALVLATTADALSDALAAADFTAARARGRLRIEVDPLRV